MNKFNSVALKGFEPLFKELIFRVYHYTKELLNNRPKKIHKGQLLSSSSLCLFPFIWITFPFSVCKGIKNILITQTFKEKSLLY